MTTEEILKAATSRPWPDDFGWNKRSMFTVEESTANYALALLAVNSYEADQQRIGELMTGIRNARRPLDDLEDALDDQIYPEQAKEGFNAPDDRVYVVNLTAAQYRLLGKALTVIDTALAAAKERQP